MHRTIINEDMTEIFYKIISNYIPKPIRKFLSKFFVLVFWIYLKFYSIIYENIVDMYLIKGKEKYSKKTITFLVLSNDVITINYFLDLVYSDILSKEYIGKRKIKDLKIIIDKNSKKYDAIFVHTDNFYINLLEKYNFLVIPRMIPLRLDVTKSIDEIFSNFNKSIRQRIRNLNLDDYSYEIATDKDSFNFFYHNMYVPYAQNFGKHAIIWEYRDMKFIFETGRILFLKYKNKRVLGVLIYDFNKTISSLDFEGIIGEEEYFLKKGIGIASNYFSILWAKEKNLKYLDFGICRPFLNNGILQHNRQWDIKIKRSTRKFVGDKYRESYGLNIFNYSDGMKSFLLNNPFIIMEKRKLKSMVFVKDKNNISSEQLKRFKKIYLIPEITELIIKSPDNLMTDKGIIIKK